MKLFEDNELINAVVYCDFESVLKLTNTSFKDPIYDIGGFEKACPIFIISKCLDMFFEEFVDGMNFQTKRNKNKQILALFIKQFHVEEIDNILIEDYTGCCNQDAEDLIEEKNDVPFVIDMNKDLNEQLEKVVMDNRCWRTIKELCELGANPNAMVENDNPIITFTEECVFLGGEKISSILKKNQKKLDIYDIEDIIWWARNYQNFKLMEKYRSKYTCLPMVIK